MGYRILLFDPPTLVNVATHSWEVLHGLFVRPQEPYGALVLASYLASRGHDAWAVSLDAYLYRPGGDARQHDGSPPGVRKFTYETRDVVHRLVRECQPDVVGVSVVGVVKEYAAHMLIRILREVRPDLPVVLGGHHASLNRLRMARLPDPPDAVVAGEGEEAMTTWLGGGLKRSEVVPGCVFLRNGSPPLDGGLAALLRSEDLDYPVDHGRLLLPEGFSLDDLQHIVMQARGCVAHCTFCTTHQFWRGRVRYRPRGILEREIDALSERRPRTVEVMDANVNQAQGHFKDLCDVLGKFSGIDFIAQTRVNLVDAEDVDRMACAGFRYLDIGIETSDETVLQAMAKGYEGPEQPRRAWKMIQAAGLVPGGYFMVGYPGSSYESDLRTYEWARSCVEDEILQNIIVSYYIPYGGPEAVGNRSPRILVANTSEWTGLYPVHEVIGEGGRIVYDREAMREVFMKLAGLGREAMRRFQPEERDLW